MRTRDEIEDALRALPLDQARSVGDWLQDYLEDQWDRQIARDAEGGKLDKPAAQAVEDHRAGRTKPLHEMIENSATREVTATFRPTASR